MDDSLCDALELLNLNSENPHTDEVLRNGGFTMNRTSNPFKNVDVDMALNQIINARTKSKPKGMMA